jgi:hypothetical protein
MSNFGIWQKGETIWIQGEWSDAESSSPSDAAEAPKGKSKKAAAEGGN